MDLVRTGAALSVYIGGTAQVWSYTSTHDKLVIELSVADGSHRVYLVLIGCVGIWGRTWWKVSSPRIEVTNSGFLFVDGDLRVEFLHEFQLVDASPS
nr:hypothetical protein MFMH1_32250 [Myxococcus sp. MH1]